MSNPGAMKAKEVAARRREQAAALQLVQTHEVNMGDETEQALAQAQRLYAHAATEAEEKRREGDSLADRLDRLTNEYKALVPEYQQVQADWNYWTERARVLKDAVEAYQELAGPVVHEPEVIEG